MSIGRQFTAWSSRLLFGFVVPAVLSAQGVTTGAVAGFATDSSGIPIVSANVVAVHVPSGTQYRAVARGSGAYTLPNLRVGGPYRVTASFVGFVPGAHENVFVALGETQRLDFRLARVTALLGAVQVTGRGTEATRTGAATFVDPLQVAALPSVKRSTRDLTRLDPRSDGNFSFAGRNWLFNSISLDGSYFSNSFGLDDPAPGGQTNAEPVPFDAVEQVQVSIAPFDVRQGGFTGASINTVTKSGTNEFHGSAYSYLRNDAMIGNKVSGSKVVANPSLSYNQSGASFSGPIRRDKIFFFINGEIERTEDPGSNFIANRGAPGFGVSRVTAANMDAIRTRLQTYGYETGPYEGYINKTDNNKLLAKLDWNVNAASTFTLRYNYLDASRDLPPHPFVLSFANTGRGPNTSSLPFQNSGYQINNQLHSFAAELNSRTNKLANRLFLSYNGFRDFRNPFSAPFPTIEIGEGGVTYTTAGHEPFSIHNILDQDVYQLTNNVSFFRGSHTYTLGANFERFSFFNSFNIFRHGVFFLPAFIPVGSTFSSLNEFFTMTDPADPNRKDFGSMITSSTEPFKGELIDVGQFSIYLQDELLATPRLTLTYGGRVDFPTYFTDPVANPYSIGLNAADENGNPETVNQAKLPGATAMFSPRVGFNWDMRGDKSMLLRGGTGVFTGRVPFVWVGNVISNPGANPNLFPISAQQVPTRKESILQTSFDLNAMDPDFKWPQTWTTNVAVEHALPWALRSTLEVLYAKDLNAVFMRNADLVAPVRTLADGRPFFGGAGSNERNTPADGAGIYVIDNTDKGYSYNITAQLRKAMGEGSAGIGYSFTQAKNTLKSTEIASVLWQNQPVQGNPNKPELSYSEFGQRNRIVGDATYVKRWSDRYRTQIGAFMEIAEGNRFAGAGGNRYSFIYSGDVNGDGATGNDLIYIPRTQSEITFDPCTTCPVVLSPAEQWTRFDAFINQDKYLKEHRGAIAERFGLLNPWYTNLDLRVQQDVGFTRGSSKHGFQVSLDVMNLANLVNSDWGVRKIADPTATSPLTLVRFDGAGNPVFNFTGPGKTFIDDPDLLSRWRAQIGVKYFFE
jgi:hypothetical protein